MAGSNKSSEKNRIEKYDKARKVIRGYFDSRKEHTRNNIPATIYLVDGMVDKKLIEDSRNGLLEDTDRLGDKAISFYGAVDRYDDLFLVSVARDKRSDFVKNVMESNIYIDKDFLIYIHDSYFVNDTREDGYEVLDRYILNKIAIYMDTDRMYTFFETMYNELHESRDLEQLLMFIDDFAESTDRDNDFLAPWRKNGDGSGKVDVHKALMNLLNLYITYLYNEVIIHGNSKALDKNNINNFISFVGNLKASIVTTEVSFFDTFTYDMCGIKCKVFNLHLKQVLLDVIDRVERSQVIGLGGGISSYLFQKRLDAYNTVLKDIKALTIRMPIDGDEDENLVTDGCGGGKHSKWYYVKKKEKELVSANLTMDSMCITKDYFEAIDVMRLTQKEMQATSFFKESFNFHITRTENEKINQFARRIAQTQILYTNMNNIWNKQDATDKAFDIKSDIDDEIDSTTSESYRKALLNLKENLLKIMAEGEKVDIKSQRQSIYVNYPVGYKG